MICNCLSIGIISMKKISADPSLKDVSVSTETEAKSPTGDSKNKNTLHFSDANTNENKKSMDIPISYNEYNLHEAITTDKSGELKDLVRKFLQLSDLLNCLLLSILWNLA